MSFYGLVPADKIMPDMFKELDDPIAKKQKRHARLSVAMYDINAKYGLDTVVLGTQPESMSRFSGSKIAFTRIPERAEFHE